jgi:predicted aconitase/predicted aconitase with swiveling domain
MMITTKKLHGQVLISSDEDLVVGPVLRSTESLSFWGGCDPVTGVIIDQSHPLAGECVADTILCLPSGRGSCTASQVLLELILNDIAPKAIVLRDRDGLVAVGALVAREVFGRSLPIVCVGKDGFDAVIAEDATYAALHSDGFVYFGTSAEGLKDCVRVGTTDATSKREMIFSDRETELLAATSNEAERMALRVIFQYAHIMMDKPAYTPVAQAHIDGCTYIGPGGLEFVKRLVQRGGRVAVPTTLNSMSTDRRRWEALGVPKQYAKNAIALGDAYLELGCLPTFTCAPYLLAPPKLAEDIVWGESNAVVYANSVLGSRTEKYADYLDICGAIAGIVPRIGAHVPANRVPEIVLDATELFTSELSRIDELDLDTLFPVLGHLCGSKADGKLPILVGLESWSQRITKDHLKAFCAAYGTTGSSPLILIAGVSPEAKDARTVTKWLNDCGKSRICVTLQGLEETYGLLDKDAKDDTKIDLIALGNPHLSTTECEFLATLVEGRKKKESVRMIGCISREVYQLSEKHARRLEDFGMEFVSDTCWCMLLDPPVIPTDPRGVTLTNSGKYAHYGPGLTGRRFRFAGTRDCITAATTGLLPPRTATVGSRPAWLNLPRSLQQRSLSFVRSVRHLHPFHI